VTTYAAAVVALGTSDGWQAAYARLDAALGAGDGAAREAVLAGLGAASPGVRKWCAAVLDHHADARAVAGLVRLLDDPVAAVRRHAVHSLGCQPCKPQPLDVDVVSLLVERARSDASVRVRRAATHLLGCQPADARAGAALRALAAGDPDPRLRRTARWGAARHAPPEPAG
jgi:HEAT repeat protein